ncbi:CocE/NonD family hydrolase [Sphingomonas sp. BAUL-RG-20F-R05-02]|uniref:CocE/NonD family hydrolase n=1 Tax=Sphingomonas sp. BAUL-RG-20F-R05-02 TaxID=2914830 RepID=UPI001F594480|nr:CocE/NonD family hydrolase [Sphingomonas sp. BAUL-RG-20F-R05-02]
MKLVALVLAGTALVSTLGVSAQTLPNGIPAKFAPVTATFDYDRREVDVKMRDGVALHMILIVPKGAHDAPILFERTPYNADNATSKQDSAHAVMLVGPAFAEMLRAGYILAVEDVRGKYGSKGEYVNERPLIGPLNGSKVDHSTDAFDTIDWLTKHVPESNGRVGIVGTSYDGMMAAMALVHPHPALKAAAPMNPVINTWMGDDDFHGGAFRMAGYDYYFSQDTKRGSGDNLWRDAYDDYDTFLRAGSASGFVKSRGLDQIQVVKDLHDHPDYDAYWQAQALETILPREKATVPTLWIGSLWDQEDMYGAAAAYEATAKNDPDHLEHLAIGPWSHGGWAGTGDSLGPIRFQSDTGTWFRQHVLIPFLDSHLKTGAAPADIAPVTVFQTGSDVWQRLPTWPSACAQGCAQASRKLYLQAGGALSFTAPTTDGADEYVSDPAKPIPYRLRPIRPTYATGSTWRQWLVDDQRPFSDRTDVLTYETEPLTTPLALAGAPIADLVAATTGTDGDFVVKLIDVYPDEYFEKPDLGGYQLPIAMDILRGRYRESFSTPKPITSGAPLGYRFALPNVNHVFLPGHRIMVQIQSSWFPLYDRNPQTFVPNIFDAKPGDYRKATIRVFHAPAQASAIELPVVATGAAQ